MALASTDEVSTTVVRKALPQMSQLGIPITPPNYAVWYEYLRDANPALNDEMNQLLNSGRLSKNTVTDLYERYIKGGDADALKRASQGLRALLDSFKAQVDQAGGEFASYGESLEALSGRLSNEMLADDLHAFVDDLLRQTGDIVGRSGVLQQQFSSASDEVRQLQAELEKVREEATTDFLTGLGNRKAFGKELERMAHAALEKGTHTPCLIMIDIDHFKKFNDTYGHLVGDQVLQHVATLLKNSIKGKDMAARFGGEEFAILLSDTPISGSLAVAEQIRANIESNAMRADDCDQPLSVTVSLGVAWFREGETFETFLGRADRVLYKSKEAGRNRVTADR